MKNRIKELRKLHNCTQKQLCVAVNIAQPTLSGYETSSFEPDFQTAAIIADYFGVSIDFLIGHEIKPLSIPAILKKLTIEETDVLAGINQNDIDDILEYIEYIKQKKAKKKS